MKVLVLAINLGITRQIYNYLGDGKFENLDVYLNDNPLELA